MKLHPLKIIRVETEEILFDPAAQSEVLTGACHRKGSFRRVCGICDSGDGTLILPLETVSSISMVPVSYRFAPMPDSSFDGIAAEIQVRHMHGMTLIGTFHINDEKSALWGLYARFPEKA